MQLFSSILSEIVVFEVDASKGVTSNRIRTAKYSLKNSGIILQEIDNEEFDRSKKKNGIALVFITGSDVGSKDFDISDGDTASKIIENDNLLWTVYKEENNVSRIDFVRKSSLENILDEIESKNMYIAGITVSQSRNIDIHGTLQKLYEKEFNLNSLKKSKKFRAFFFDSLFDKIKLPVLLLFFILLFVNFVVFSNIKGKYENRETSYNIRLQKNKQETENSTKTNHLFREYDKIRSYPLALIFGEFLL